MHKSLHAVKSGPNVVGMINKQQKLAYNPLTPNPNAKECIQPSIRQEDRPAVEIPILSYAGGLGPYFSKLPRELRDQIFSDLLASGHPQLASVSRAMNIEVTALVYQKGVCRVNLGYDIYEHKAGVLKENCTRPVKKVIDSIRNFSIKVKVKDFSSPRSGETGEIQHIDTFMGFPLRQGYCNIRGCCNTYAKGYFGMLLWNLVLIARGLIEYETVVLHIDTDKFLEHGYEEWEVHRIFTFRCSSKKYVEPLLGQEIVRSDKDGLQLVFHPREVRGKAVREIDKVSRATSIHTYMKSQMGQHYRGIWIGRSVSARLYGLDAGSRKDFLSWSDSSLAHKIDVSECAQSPTLQQKRNLYIDFWVGEGT